jgi:lysophospholipase L1-like esterase
MAYDVKEAPCWPVNELGEIVVQTGRGSSNTVGYISSSQVAIDPDTKKVVMAGVAQLAQDSNNNIIGIVGATGSYGSPLLYPTNGQIKWGSYGDSIANVSSYANYDIRQISGTTYGASSDRMGSWVGALSNGLFRQTANCGVSGETTTQMLARESAGVSATRKAISDSASTGVQFLVNSFGINDIQALAGGASQSAIDVIVNTAITNSIAILKKQKSYGIWSITPSLLGYNLGAGTASEIATRQAAVKQFNAALSAAISSVSGELGSFIDVYSLVTTSSGAWISGYDQGDGLHPGANGCKVIYSKCVSEMLRVSGMFAPPKFAYPLATNLFPNADFSASTAGVATGLNPYASAGTATFAKSIVDWRGQNWQEVITTPTVLDGNGNVGLQIDMTIPSTTIALADVIGGEISLYIDDGAGNGSNVFQYCARLRTNTTYTDTPLYNPTISPKVNLATPLDQRIAMLPIVSPAATPATFLVSVIVLANSLVPFRVRVALPRVMKLPTTY